MAPSKRAGKMKVIRSTKKVVEVSVTESSERLTRANYKHALLAEASSITTEATKNGGSSQEKHEIKEEALEEEVAKKRKEKSRKKKRRRNEGYQRYVYRVLKQVHPEMGISSEAMTILNNLMNDMFERLADEAAKLKVYTGHMTLSSREMQGAVKLVLPGELGKHANAEAVKAVITYISYDA